MGFYKGYTLLFYWVFSYSWYMKYLNYCDAICAKSHPIEKSLVTIIFKMWWRMNVSITRQVYYWFVDLSKEQIQFVNILWNMWINLIEIGILLNWDCDYLSVYILSIIIKKEKSWWNLFIVFWNKELRHCLWWFLCLFVSEEIFYILATVIMNMWKKNKFVVDLVFGTDNKIGVKLIVSIFFLCYVYNPICKIKKVIWKASARKNEEVVAYYIILIKLWIWIIAHLYMI